MADKKYDGGRPNIPADIDRSVRTQAGHRCSITFCNEHTYLEIHHIDENRANNNIDNLILLCDKHHKMAHAGKIDRKSLREYKNKLNINIPNLNYCENFTIGTSGIESNKINTFLNKFLTVLPLSGKNIDFSEETAPTGQGLIDKQALINQGNTVLTN